LNNELRRVFAYPLGLVDVPPASRHTHLPSEPLCGYIIELKNGLTEHFESRYSLDEKIHQEYTVSRRLPCATENEQWRTTDTFEADNHYVPRYMASRLWAKGGGVGRSRVLAVVNYAFISMAGTIVIHCDASPAEISARKSIRLMLLGGHTYYTTGTEYAAGQIEPHATIAHATRLNVMAPSVQRNIKDEDD
jgi:hypothetical protein